VVPGVLGFGFLGTGFKPIIDAYVSKLPAEGLFWLNSISAGKLKIKSREWMPVGLPIGAAAMAAYFCVLLVAV
jgi:predicted cation transporter